MTLEKELKKRDAIVTCKQIISMDKYEVTGHQTTYVKMDEGVVEFGLGGGDFPKGTTDILVIYLKK